MRSVSFSPDGNKLTSASSDKTIRIWNISTQLEEACLKGHLAGIRSFCFSPDGNLLASASSDKTIRIWNI